MRKCQIYRCVIEDGNCCADCNRFNCTSRCMNSPDRCKCVGDTYPPQTTHSLRMKKMLELAQSGLPYADIAKSLGCSVKAVNANLNRMGYFRHPGRRKADELDG